ncbi:MAG: hypothetical protein SGARI_001868, partial [Bacillariaceae sp.]
MTYLSENAIPMEKFELVKGKDGREAFSQDGFIVQHTPYQQLPTGNSQELTTRQFIAPYTNIAQLPWFNTTLHFVPSKAGETLVYGGGLAASPRGGSSFMKNPVVRRLVPEKIQAMAQDFLHFYFTNLADFGYRFYNQDVQIMKGQDERKALTEKWNDMYPTSSDNGVRIFQRWMDTFSCKRPSFTMPSASGDSNGNGIIPSAWDRHAKYCPKCKRTIRRLSKASAVATT